MAVLVSDGDSRPLGWRGTVRCSLATEAESVGVVRGCVVEESRRAVGGKDPVNEGVAKELGRER